MPNTNDHEDKLSKPRLVQDFELEMIFTTRKDYGGRLLVNGTLTADIKDKGRGEVFPSFGKRIAQALNDTSIEYSENVKSGKFHIDGDLFQRIHLDKYLISYGHNGYKNGVKLVNWHTTEDTPPIVKVSFANCNPKELIAITAVAIKENAGNLGARYASFDIPSLEAVPEINNLMNKHLSKAL